MPHRPPAGDDAFVAYALLGLALIIAVGYGLSPSVESARRTASQNAPAATATPSTTTGINQD